MKILMLVNPRAGRKKGERVAQKARAAFQSQGVEMVCCCSEQAGQLSELAEREVNGDWDGIVALGGDGTLFEVINGMMRGNPELPIPLGVLPVGSGNSFSRDLDIKSHDHAIAKIIAGHTRGVDLGRCTCDHSAFHFINILGFGFVSDVALIASAHKRWGDLSYLIGVFQMVRRLQSYPLEVEIDGRQFQRDNVFVEICNSTKTGGTMHMAPQARIDDGLLDVVLLNRITRLRVITSLPKLYKGTHLQLPEVETFTGRRMSFRPARSKVLTPDGEILGRTPIQVSVLPGKLRIFG
ncbi:MAG: diacylglycerol kinase family lipid kinase [Desulfobacteraceae bacterium]|nr:diacylglycerol kinase family lipid kinase [Desulfobacteraceae bacterium]